MVEVVVEEVGLDLREPEVEAVVQWGQILGGDSRLSWEVTVAGLYCTMYCIVRCTLYTFLYKCIVLYCVLYSQAADCS